MELEILDWKTLIEGIFFCREQLHLETKYELQLRLQPRRSKASVFKYLMHLRSMFFSFSF